MFLTYNGPAKSTPTCENARSSDTLDCGRRGGGGALHGFPVSFLHFTHFNSNCFTSYRPNSVRSVPSREEKFSSRIEHSVFIVCEMLKHDEISDPVGTLTGPLRT